MQQAAERELARRRAWLEEALPRIVADLVARGARLIVLFGSEGRGERRGTADLDLLVVLESDEPFVERVARLHRELRPGVALDLVAYTPAEFEAVRGRPFVRRILSEGRVLHAA